MPLISTIKPEEATGEVAEIYDQIHGLRGRVANTAQLFSVSPALLKQQMLFVSHYMNHKSLSPALLACIRMLVSDKNGCSYCIDFNASMLINLLNWSPKEVEAIRQDPMSAAHLSEEEKKMLLFVLKAVRTPHAITGADVQHLRDHGYNDSDILDATNHGARMSAIDIIFDAFKIEKDF